MRMVSQARWSTYQSPRKLRSTAIFIQQLITVKGELALDPTAEEANSKCSNHMSSTWQVKMVGNWNSTPKSLLSWPSVSRIAPALRNSREAFFDLLRLLGSSLRLASSSASSQRAKVLVLKSSSSAPLLFVRSSLVSTSATILGSGIQRSNDLDFLMASMMMAISIAVRRSCLDDGFAFFKASNKLLASMMPHWGRRSPKALLKRQSFLRTPM